MWNLKMTTNIFQILSCVCSLLLIPASLLPNIYVFYTVVLVNFIFFHGIWISRYFGNRGTVFTNDFFMREMRLPTILFALCGISGGFLSGAL